MCEREDAIWMGSTRCALMATAGAATAFAISEWRAASPEDEAHIAALRRRLEIQQPSRVFVPAVPALDIVPMKRNTDVASWPKILASSPLIKVPVDSSDSIPNLRALASGCRSALLCCEEDGKWYRIKGCGNDDKGFVVRDDARMLHCRNIRGSAFFHTAARELYITALLEQKGYFNLVNKAMGMYEYSGAANLPAGPEFPLVAIVMQTCSDRRFGCHVLSGLLTLLPLILDESSLTESDVLARFPVRRLEKQKEWLADTSDLISRYAYSHVPKGFGVNLYDPADCLDLTPATLCRAMDYPLPLLLHPPPAPAPSSTSSPSLSTPPFQWTSDASGANASKVPFDSARWLTLWQKIAAVPSGSGDDDSRVLAYMFSRFGYEIGRFLRDLHDLRISWGTYQDCFCFEGQWHCNAHGNNIAVLPDEVGMAKQCFLGFLDFDMAFDEESFFDTSPFSHRMGQVGAASAAEFDDLLLWERLNLLEVVTGGGDGAVGMPLRLKEEVLSKSAVLAAVFTTLNDQLVLSFLSGYDKSSAHVVAFDAKLHAAGYRLIKLALVLSEGLRA